MEKRRPDLIKIFNIGGTLLAALASIIIFIISFSWPTGPNIEFSQSQKLSSMA